MSFETSFTAGCRLRARQAGSDCVERRKGLLLAQPRFEDRLVVRVAELASKDEVLPLLLRLQYGGIINPGIGALVRMQDARTRLPAWDAEALRLPPSGLVERARFVLRVNAAPSDASPVPAPLPLPLKRPRPFPLPEQRRLGGELSWKVVIWRQ